MVWIDEIVKLEKRKLGSEYKLIRIYYYKKGLFSKKFKQVDVMRSSFVKKWWKTIDTEENIEHSDILNEFWESDSMELEMNK